MPPSAAGGYSRIVQIHPVLHLELSHVEGLCLLGGGHVRVRRRRHRLRLRRMQEVRLVQDFLVWTRQRCAAFQIPARKIQRDLKIQCMKREGQGKAARLRGQELKKYATEGDRLLLPLLSDPPRLHLFLSVQRADSRRVAPAAHFYAANIFFTEVVTFLLASFFFLYSPRPS